MKANQAAHCLSTMCRVLRVSASGYYAWQRRGASARTRQDAQLLERIRQFHQQSRGTYGAPRIHRDLRAVGVRVGRKRVARLLKQAALRGVSRRKWPVTTIRAEHARPAPDLVKRAFTATGPNHLWVADITYIPTRTGTLYLAVVLDVWSRRIVGWAMATHLRTSLVVSALDMALTQRRPQAVIHHSDQGCQYTAIEFGHRCRDANVRPSMGSVGDCYDNAMCESFFATLECELLDRVTLHTPGDARTAVFDFIEGWYNPRRRHSSLGYESPLTFERRHAQAAARGATAGTAGDPAGYQRPPNLPIVARAAAGTVELVPSEL
jgi:putative transposase